MTKPVVSECSSPIFLGSNDRTRVLFVRLPYDRIVNRFARLSIPNKALFALIGDPNGGDIAGRELRFSGVRTAPLLAAISRCRWGHVRPAGLREMLWEFSLTHCHDRSIIGEHHCA
jgi:hypothetical protein